MTLSKLMAAIAALLFLAALANANPAEAKSKKQSPKKENQHRVIRDVTPMFAMVGEEYEHSDRTAIEMNAKRRNHRRHQQQQSHGGGLVTVNTAAGISITCSPSFAGPAASLIAAAVAQGIKFRRITCYSRASTHTSGSNHYAGDAFDSHPSIPASLVRAHGLRSGCDFRDCPHVDNARNVGGVAFWNSVKHRRYAGGHRSNKRYASVRRQQQVSYASQVDIHAMR